MVKYHSIVSVIVSRCAGCWPSWPPPPPPPAPWPGAAAAPSCPGPAPRNACRRTVTRTYSKAMCKCRRRSVFLVGAMAPAPLGELAAVWGRHTAPSPMYGRYGNFCRYIVDIPMHRARSKCRSRVRVLAPTTEQVPVFFRESVYRPYDAVSGLYRLALSVGLNSVKVITDQSYILEPLDMLQHLHED